MKYMSKNYPCMKHNEIEGIMLNNNNIKTILNKNRQFNSLKKDYLNKNKIKRKIL